MRNFRILAPGYKALPGSISRFWLQGCIGVVLNKFGSKADVSTALLLESLRCFYGEREARSLKVAARGVRVQYRGELDWKVQSILHLYMIAAIYFSGSRKLQHFGTSGFSFRRIYIRFQDNCLSYTLYSSYFI